MVPLALIVLAIGAALVPLPAATVERLYAEGLYPLLQPRLTGASNLVPFAILDVLLLGATLLWVVLLARDVARRATLGWARLGWRLAVRTAAGAAAAYLVFLVAWGLNYRRTPIEEKIPFDRQAVTADAARALARRAAVQLNALYEGGHRGIPAAAIDPPLASALARAQADVGARWTARAARPKRTLLEPYFLAAGVEGMTDPFFLEILVPEDLLPFERPFVLAHEWGHLAGFADESEANFIGWLTCMHGSGEARYSGWLFLYREVMASLDPDDRTAILAELAAGPREDLIQIADRLRRQLRPRVSAAGWRAYDTVPESQPRRGGNGELRARGEARARKPHRCSMNLVIWSFGSSGH